MQEDIVTYIIRQHEHSDFYDLKSLPMDSIEEIPEEECSSPEQCMTAV